MTMLCAIRRLGYKGCSARLQRGHWVPQQRIKETMRRRGVDEERIAEIVWDKRAYDFMCSTHHHLFDYPKTIKLAEREYPADFREWADEHGFYFAGSRDGWRAEHR